MAFALHKTKRLRLIFIVYWFLLAYIISALIWWFIALNHQNHQMALYKSEQIKKDNPEYYNTIQLIQETERRKFIQYIGEGSIFFLVIIAGAIFIYRAVKRQFILNQQQQNFMMAITHELKTPIAIAKLNLETIQKRNLDEAKQQQLIQNTLQETNRLTTLCNNMLVASQIESSGYHISKEMIDLSDLATSCVNEFAKRYAQKKFEQHIQPNVQVVADKLLLEIALNNLIDNAIKYSPKDSTITVSVQQNTNTLLAVKDEGKGIDAFEKEKIFNKYYRIGNKATKEAKGTGLGLYITKKILQQHKAAIFVTDNQPSGSIFTIKFSV